MKMKARPSPERKPQPGAAPAPPPLPGAPVVQLPQPAAGPSQGVATALIQMQAELLQVRSRAELAYFAANEPRRMLNAQQIVLLTRGRQGELRVRAISSLAHIDRSSPAILWLESMVHGLEREYGLAKDCAFKATAFDGGYQSFGRGYPLSNLLWAPWLDTNGNVIAGMLLARTTPYSAQDAALARHVAGVLSQAWRAASKSAWTAPAVVRLSRRGQIAAAIAAIAAAVFPVPMTALAPVEAAPRGASIITAGVDGVVKSVLVEPSETVTEGQVLLRMDDTTLRNRYEVAEREVGVAAMKYKKAAQLAFTDARGRHELAIAQAELDLKVSERDYAMDLLARGEIKAERDGVAFFGDKKDLVGKPVAVGEKLMEIARPAEIEFRIDLGVADAIALNDGARIKIFLDSDPLSPIEARLIRAGYRARLRESQQLAFRLVAEAAPEAAAAVRLGARGTAQVYSDHVPMAFYLLRRPIAAARQWLGI